MLRSAIANAQQKEGAGDVEQLFVRECHADQGPSMKRIRPQPMGRAFRIQKRTAHLTVTVEERPEPAGSGPEPGARRRRKTRRPAGASRGATGSGAGTAE